MEHNEALNYLNEIKASCDTLSREDLSLVEIKTNIQYAMGCTILIKSFLNSVCKQQVSTIAQKYRLAMQEQHEGIMIYEPVPTEVEL